MAIPPFDQFLHPILALAAETDITRKTTAVKMADHFHLSADETAARIPSGTSTYVENRNGWAMTFLTKAGLISKVAPHLPNRRVRTQVPRGTPHCHHREGLGQRARLAGGVEHSKKKPDGNHTSDGGSGKTPIEALDEAITTINADVKSRLLATILEQTPTFFEQLVLDVLLAMGYGGSRKDAAEHLGRSGDEGIDGRINQDPLGFDQILVRPNATPLITP